ncbi:hypothetical protein L599_000100000320 [Luteimonas sp. J16]|jgi:hypothetical protein|uniref:hypothetical protein n=1 Tax=unclassified Luteimonas TaxID=2629088 RepID=UPI0011A97197|nr:MULTISPECIES: hypothetical protein [unclassified Luteimonas]TWG94316.1 hypothetical protein L599_000100000320 [Luteimonas sp. J16]
MEQKSVEEFVASAALLGAHLTRQCESACAQLHDLSVSLSRAMDEGQSRLAASARDALRESMATELPAALQVLGQGTRQLHAMIERARVEQAALERRARWMGLKAVAVALVGALAAVAGSGYVAAINVARSREATVRLEVIKALDEVTITSCDGRPCIKLADGLRRWERNDHYVLVDSDPPPELQPR